MSYVQFLTWIVANAAKFKRALELLAEIAELFKPAAQEGTLGIAQDLTAGDTPCPEETAALEAQAISAYAALTPADQPQAVMDGSRLRKLFEILGPLLPVLINMLGK